jgi:hypothetical protein
MGRGERQRGVGDGGGGSAGTGGGARHAVAQGVRGWLAAWQARLVAGGTEGGDGRQSVFDLIDLERQGEMGVGRLTGPRVGVDIEPA